MGWATKHIERLKAGETVSFRPFGGSMAGLIESGQMVTVAPIGVNDSSLKVHDIVLCKVGGNQYLHLIKKVANGQFQIGNNKGRINGWIRQQDIFGKCIEIKD